MPPPRVRRPSVEIWINRDATVFLDSKTCDQQRDFAASIWMVWSEMVPRNGAGVTIKSYTGRVLASSELGKTATATNGSRQEYRLYLKGSQRTSRPY